MGMLILARNPGQAIRLVQADGTETVITNVGNEKLKIGIDAPRDVLVLRSELAERPRPTGEPKAA